MLYNNSYIIYLVGCVNVIYKQIIGIQKVYNKVDVRELILLSVLI